MRQMSAHLAVANHVPMRGSERQVRGIGVDTAAWPIRALVDLVLALCVEWRETTRAVAETYRPWCLAPAGEEAGRFAAYPAAPD
jgi:hypothetical protein